jgi:hypothetical protein
MRIAVEFTLLHNGSTVDRQRVARDEGSAR